MFVDVVGCCWFSAQRYYLVSTLVRPRSAGPSDQRKCPYICRCTNTVLLSSFVFAFRFHGYRRVGLWGDCNKERLNNVNRHVETRQKLGNEKRCEPKLDQPSVPRFSACAQGCNRAVARCCLFPLPHSHPHSHRTHSRRILDSSSTLHPPPRTRVTSATT